MSQNPQLILIREVFSIFSNTNQFACRYLSGRLLLGISKISLRLQAERISGVIYNYETIIPTGITRKKICRYMHDSLLGGLLLKMQKYFEVMLKIFISPTGKKGRISIGLCKYILINLPLVLLFETMKQF